MVEAGGIDPRILEAFADHHERLSGLMLADTSQVEDATEKAIAAATRLMRFEVWLDRLEQQKRAAGSLPPAAEQGAVEAFTRAEEDARALASALIEAVRPLSRAAFWDEALPYMSEAVGRVGEIDVGALFAAARGPFAELLQARGMDSRLTDPLFRSADEAARGFQGITLSSREAGVLLLQDGRRQASMQARNRQPLPLLDGDTWVYAGALRTLQPDPSAVIDGIPRTSPWAGALALAKALTETYEDRARQAAREGVHVHETGFPWIVILAILAIMLIVAGLTIMILCGIGTITDQNLCKVGIAMLFIGLFIGCILLEGEVGAAPGGVACTLTIGAAPFEG
jgi:hypothetical protein